MLVLDKELFKKLGDTDIWKDTKDTLKRNFKSTRNKKRIF
jgi:hypothetical protein